VLTVAVAVVLLVLAVAVLPASLAPRRVFATAGDAVRAQNEVRTTMLQGLAGLAVLLGAYVTWRQLQLSRQQLGQELQATRAQLAIAQEGQITERFTRAIDQLGRPELSMQLGGIFALERIARDTPAEREMIAQVLTAYVRDKAPWPGPAADTPVPAAHAELQTLQSRAPTVEWALVVLGRTVLTGQQNKRIRLNMVDLRGANLEDLHLETIDFAYSHLEGAWLRKTHLERAWLVNADLREADLAGAHLDGARLHRANLMGARNLDHADLSGAVADSATMWPDDFQPQAAGVKVDTTGLANAPS
jgi:hypothetical protein